MLYNRFAIFSQEKATIGEHFWGIYYIKKKSVFMLYLNILCILINMYLANGIKQIKLDPTSARNKIVRVIYYNGE